MKQTSKLNQLWNKRNQAIKHKEKKKKTSRRRDQYLREGRVPFAQVKGDLLINAEDGGGDAAEC